MCLICRKAGETLASLHSQVELGGIGGESKLLPPSGRCPSLLLGAVGDGSEGSELLAVDIGNVVVDISHIGRIAGHMSGDGERFSWMNPVKTSSY